jgi:hypothetical protein
MMNIFDYDTNIDKLYRDDLVFSDAVVLVAHNSFASLEDGWTLHPIQQYDFIHQFYYGARGFMIDVHEDNNHELVLLHNNKLKNAAGVGTSVTKTFYLEDFLRGIENLLNKHNDTVITLLIENKQVAQKEIMSSLVKAKLSKYLLLNDPNNLNLTFGDMRHNNQRLVIFAENGNKTEEGIYPTTYYKETTYSLEQDKSCFDRHENRVAFADLNVNIFIMNHFYTKSCSSLIDASFGVNSIVNIAKYSCQSTNDYNAIMKRVNLCIDMGNKPTFIAVDFIEQGANGGALKVVSDLVDKSFYNQYLQYSNETKKSFSNKIDYSIVLASAGSFATGGLLVHMAWSSYYKRTVQKTKTISNQIIHQHIEL